MRVNLLEENSKDSNLTTLISLFFVSASKVHKVDFCGVIVSFNSVLRGRMEVELKGLVITLLIISVQKVHRTTLWINRDLPRIVMVRHITIFIKF